jgi:hypothetical protein
MDGAQAALWERRPSAYRTSPKRVTWFMDKRIRVVVAKPDLDGQDQGRRMGR